MQKILLTSLFALGLTGAALAQPATDFATADADISGGVSLAEAQVVWPDLTADAFAAADKDGNGELSVDEFNALLAGSGTAQ